jgi:iron complex outermembrane receptor protein
VSSFEEVFMPVMLPPIEVTGAEITYAQQNQLPLTTESITAGQISRTINATGPEDTIKYLPSLLVRKRYIGDTQAPLATRTTGVNASARSLVYADGVLLAALINNNNQNGSPQWFMVAPQEIDRVDVMYGPYAAQFPGNAYGAVMRIGTRMPDRFTGEVGVTGSLQTFSQYGTNANQPSGQYSMMLGDRSGKFSWRLSARHLDSYSQPLSYGTLAQSSVKAGTSLPIVNGVWAARSRTGTPMQVIGAGGITHTRQDNATLKLAYDFTPDLTATYTLGYWQNRARAHSETYLSTANGAAYYGAASGSANIGGYAYSASTIAGQFFNGDTQQEHLMQSLELGTHSDGVFDWQAAVSDMRYLQDLSSQSTGLFPAAADGGPGRITDMGGTGWSTLDLKGTWRPQGESGAHIVSFGAHDDAFRLDSPTYTSADWRSGSTAALFGNASGKTETRALWLQDAWRITPSLTATLGARQEWWRAFDGHNYAIGSNGAGVSVEQPVMSRSGLSPKASLAWNIDDTWTLTGSVGRALRFPTVGELYQTVQTGSTYLQANPYLSPERVLSSELALARDTDTSHWRLSLFNEYVSDALISQTTLVPGYPVLVSTTQNVGKTRQRGVELVGQQDNVLVHGLSLSGSLTYVDARIVSDDGFVSSTGSTAVGKRVPYVPAWRATLAATYRPDDQWSYTVAGRFSSRVYGTVDNSDVNSAAYTGFQSFLVFDARVRYQVDKHWSMALGVDNLTNRKYFLYHPFPQRTYYAEIKYAF